MVKVLPEDPSCRSIRLVTEMMVLVGEGMGRSVLAQDLPRTRTVPVSRKREYSLLVDDAQPVYRHDL